MSAQPPRVLMLLENNHYPQDVRVRLEAESLSRGGYEVTLLAPQAQGQPSREKIGGVAVRRFPLPPTGASAYGIVAEYVLANLQLYVRALALLPSGIDIVHLNNPPDTLFGIAWAARAVGARVVYDVHDLAPELFVAKFGDRRVAGVLRWLERRSAQSAHRLLTVNDSLRELIADRDRIPLHRITIVRNAPPTRMLGEARPARGGVLPDPRLIFVGNIESQDGVETLPELVRILRDEQELPGVRLTVVGDGGARRAVEARCRELGVADRIKFTGRVAHERISGVLADADICLEPAPCNELNHRCSMVKVYEYMAAGRPIVGYRLREVERLAGDGMLYGDRGEVGELAEHVVRLARDPELRARLGRQLRQRARERTWEDSSQALLEAYTFLTAP